MGEVSSYIGYHVCKSIPDDCDISFSRHFAPTLTVGTDEGDTPFHFEKKIKFCPWCASDIDSERAKWIEMQEDDIRF